MLKARRQRGRRGRNKETNEGRGGGGEKEGGRGRWGRGVVTFVGGLSKTQCSVLLTMLIITLFLPYAYSISASEIFGFDHIDIINDHTLELLNQQHELLQHHHQQQQQSHLAPRGGGGLDIALDTSNIQQCVRMCWLFTSCKAVTYSPKKSQPSCRLLHGVDDLSVGTVPDSNSVTVNMTHASVKKKRLFGCDKRPCDQNQLCITRSKQDIYSCLPLASTICGEPSVHIGNATISSDGLGHTHYRCNDGFAPSPEGIVTSECDKKTGDWSPVSLSCQFVDCGPPSDLSGATVNYTATYHGSMSKYSCLAGHYSPSEGNMDTICQASGQWSVSPSPCRMVECGQPTPAENGQISLPILVDENGNPATRPVVIEDMRTSYGGYATHSCLKGYTSSPTSVQSACLNSGQWSNRPDSFQCQPVDCGSPPEIHNTTTVYNSTTFPSNVTYSCVEGYHTPGTDTQNSSSQCQYDGSWSRLNLTCLSVDCGIPPDLPGILVTTNSTTPGSIAYLKCSNTSHLLKGRDQRTCNASGMWSETNASCAALPCVTPPSVANSTLTVKTNGDTYFAVYTSLQGFMFSTGNISETYECIDGLWEDFPDNLSILPVQCGPPPIIPNTDVVIILSDTDNSKATYSCHVGFKNETVYSQLTCLETGKWSKEEINCTRITCGNPETVAHSRYNKSQEYSYGDQIVYECENGFSMKTSNDTTISCTETGWETVRIECVRLQCGPPPVVQNASYVVNGESLLYSCDDMFVLKDASISTRTCQTGDWSEEEVVCVYDGCPEPPVVENATFSFNSTGRGSVVAYTCNGGFSLNNESSFVRFCQENLEWSSEEITCESKDCGTAPSVNNTDMIYSKTSTGFKAEYHCKPGYALQPSTTSLNFDEPNFKPLGRGRRSSDVFIPVPDSGSDPSSDPGSDPGSDPDSNPVWITYCNNSSGTWSSDMVKPDNECIPADCGNPPEVDNALALPTTSNTFGHAAIYQCIDGFQFESIGESAKMCGETGLWEGQVQCVARGCEEIQAMPHSRIIEMDLTISGHVVFECDEGYYASPSSSNSSRFIKVTCQNNLTWSEADPGHCIPVDCEQPRNVPNTGSSPDFKCLKRCLHPVNRTIHVEIEGRKPGDAAIYTCGAGQEHWWFDRRICMENGSWINSKIQCKDIDCGHPPHLNNGFVMFNSTILGSTANYQCNDSYELLTREDDRDKVTMCQNDGTWSTYFHECVLSGLTVCPQTEYYTALHYGTPNITSFREGGTITYTCYSEYHIRLRLSDRQIVFVDNVTLHCSDGEWQGKKPKCQHKDCGSPPNVENGIETVSTTTYNSKVMYNCSDSYVFPGPVSKTCFANGHWSNDTVECVHRDSMYCLPPAEIKDMKLDYASHVVGSKTTYRCLEGYVNNSKEVECLSTGSWSSLKDFKCVPVDCHSPPVIKNTNIHVHETSFGGYAIYTCSLYNLDDETRTSRSQCQANATWSHVDSPCFHCSTPPQLHNTANRTEAKHLYNIGEIVSSGLDGYTIFPNDTVVKANECRKGGEWSEIGVEICKENGTLDPNALMDVAYISNNRSELVTHYMCKEGYRIEGLANISKSFARCHFQRGWLTDDLLHCIPVDCGSPLGIKNASVSVNGTGYLSEITYTCDVRFIPKGSVMTSVCRHNGKWSPVDLRCDQCSTDRNDLENGRVVEHNNATNSTSQTGVAVCDDEYLLYSKNRSVQPEVTCATTRYTNYLFWKGLKFLTCARSVWIDPNTNDMDIRLDRSYSSYNVCLEVSTKKFSARVEIVLQASDGDGGHSGSLTTSITEETAEIIQVDYEQGSTTETFSIAYDRDVNTNYIICLQVFTYTSSLKLWMDGFFVGEIHHVKIPFRDVNYIKMKKADRGGYSLHSMIVTGTA